MAKPKLIKRVLRTDFNKDNPLPENLLFLKNLRPLYHAITTYQEDGKVLTVVEYPVRRAAIIAGKLRLDDVEDETNNANFDKKYIKSIFKCLNKCFEHIPFSSHMGTLKWWSPHPERRLARREKEFYDDPIKLIDLLAKAIEHLASYEGKYQDLSNQYEEMQNQLNERFTGKNNDINKQKKRIAELEDEVKTLRAQVHDRQLRAQYGIE